MEIDWDKLHDDLGPLIKAAGDRTDEKLAKQMSTATRMTDEEVKAFFPDPADVRKLADLMAIVKSAGDRNDKINNIVRNAEQFGGVIFTLLSKFA
jgi:hypothetical protein